MQHISLVFSHSVFGTFAPAHADFDEHSPCFAAQLSKVDENIPIFPVKIMTRTTRTTKDITAIIIVLIDRLCDFLFIGNMHNF